VATAPCEQQHYRVVCGGSGITNTITSY